MCHRPGKLVFPSIRSFQNLQHPGTDAGWAAKPPLPVLSFSCLNHKGKRDPTQPLPPAHSQSESTHSAADSQFPCSIFRVPAPTLPSHATSQLELHHTMELQPQWSLYFPQPHYRTRSREKIALLHLCADPVHTLLLQLFNRLRPLPLAQSPGCVSCPSSPALSQCLTSLPNHKHQLKPPANSAASCRLHGLSRVLLSLAVNCYMPSVLSAHRVTPLLSSFLREGMLDLAL